MYISQSRIVIAIALLSLYACLEGYLLLRALSLSIAKKTDRKIPLWVYWPIALLGAGLYLYTSFSRGGPRSLFSLASSYWGLFIFIPFFILADILSIGTFLFRRARLHSGQWIRQGVLRQGVLRLSVLVVALVTIALGSYSARYATATGYSVTIEKPLPKNTLRVVLISDLHIGSMVHKKELERIVSKINTLEGDIVLIAGDIIDRDLDVYIKENLGEELGEIKAPLGVYAVPGNHDYFGGGAGILELEKQLAAAGVKMLADETVLVDNAFYLTGRNDLSAGRRGAGRKPLSELTRDLDPSLPLLVMDHQPVNLGEAEACGADLQVSGHTHGGQIWPGPIFTKRLYENAYGFLRKGNTAIVVTCGCGTWGPPLRIGTRSEIVYIDLKNP